MTEENKLSKVRHIRNILQSHSNTNNTERKQRNFEQKMLYYLYEMLHLFFSLTEQKRETKGKQVLRSFVSERKERVLRRLCQSFYVSWHYYCRLSKTRIVFIATDFFRTFRFCRKFKTNIKAFNVVMENPEKAFNFKIKKASATCYRA